MQSGSITQLAWLRSRRGANYHLLIFLLEPAKPSLCALLLSSLHFHLVASFNGGLQGGRVAAAARLFQKYEYDRLETDCSE